MRYLLIIFLFGILVSCKKSKKTDSEPVLPAPAKAILLSPAANAPCNQGTIISATESAVTLKWNSATNANSYDVFIKNLLTGVITSKSVTTTELTDNFLQNTPYSWYVVSKSSTNTATAQSETWKFYNSGTVSPFYAPYPADLLTPGRTTLVTAVAGKTTLTWNGADADNDIIGYDVYAGNTTSMLAIVKSNTTDSTFDLTVVSGSTYYWKVVTKDAKNNTSTSETYTFKIN